MNSWLLSMRCPDLTAIERAIATASVKASTATMMAGNSIACSAGRDRSGIDSGGSASPSAPTVSMPVCEAPSQWFSAAASTLPTTMATIM